MKYQYNTALFTNGDSATKYYIIGLILADGYIDKYERRIEVTLKEGDKDYLASIRDIVCPGKPLKYRQTQNAYKFLIDNAEICKEVMKFVNDRQKSKFLMFPYGIPDEHLLDFIRGYSDGDGNISVKLGRQTVKGETKFYYGLRYRILGTKQFLAGLEFNLRRLGISTFGANPHRKGQENCYYIEYGFKSAARILEAIYAKEGLRLERKYQVYKLISNSDSDQLAERYDTISGHYNTHGIASKKAIKV